MYNKWVSCWGNASSLTFRRESVYAKDITLRYPIKMCFDGSKLRFHFSNVCGTQDITISEAYVAKSAGGSKTDAATAVPITFSSKADVTVAPNEIVCSDEIDFEVSKGEDVTVSFYFADYTQMNSGVGTAGPLSKGFYAYGNVAKSGELPSESHQGTENFYFLNTVDVYTEEQNHAIICYGDSITAQSWPEYLQLRAMEEVGNTAIIRRAISGSRILREYSCISCAHYGPKGEFRFAKESDAAGATSIIILHGINDIIHPVGVEENIFRPWSDMPTAEDLIEGMRNLYIKPAKQKGLKVYLATLLPICGWRTYAPFRDEVRCQFNDWIRTTDEIDGFIDFDKALQNPEKPEALEQKYDSGDHLHPSIEGHKRLAAEIPKELF